MGFRLVLNSVTLNDLELLPNKLRLATIFIEVKCTEKRLADGLRPDPLRNLERYQGPLCGPWGEDAGGAAVRE